MDINYFITRNYGNTSDWVPGENKSKQSQFSAPRLRNFHENQLADYPEGGNNSLNTNNRTIEGYKE
jgi:hypothetical protein